MWINVNSTYHIRARQKWRLVRLTNNARLDYVYMSVRKRISGGTTHPVLTKFLRMLPMSVARSSSGGVAICYVFPVLRMTSCLHTMVMRQKAHTHYTHGDSVGASLHEFYTDRGLYWNWTARAAAPTRERSLIYTIALSVADWSLSDLTFCARFDSTVSECQRAPDPTRPAIITLAQCGRVMQLSETGFTRGRRYEQSSDM